MTTLKRGLVVSVEDKVLQNLESICQSMFEKSAAKLQICKSLNLIFSITPAKSDENLAFELILSAYFINSYT